MPSALTKMKYDEVSLVDRGANQEAHVTLFKRDESNPPPKTVKRKVKKVADIPILPGPGCGHRLGANKCKRCTVAKSALHKVQDALSKQDTEALWDSVLEFQSELENVEKSWEDSDTPVDPPLVTDFMLAVPTLPINKADRKGADMPLNKDDLAPDVLEHVEGLEAQIADLTAAQSVEKKDSTEEDIFKGLDPRVREVIEKAQQAADRAETELAKREDERLTSEYIAKAASFKNLPIEAEKFGPVLKSVALAAPEALAEIERILRAADAQEKTGEVFKQAGSDQGGTVSKREQVNAQAAELMKSDSSLTIEAARTQVYRNNPSLYDTQEV